MNELANSNGTPTWRRLNNHIHRLDSYLHATSAFRVVIERKDSSLWWPHKLLARAKAHGRHDNMLFSVSIGKDLYWYGEAVEETRVLVSRFPSSSWLSSFFVLMADDGLWDPSSRFLRIRRRFSRIRRFPKIHSAVLIGILKIRRFFLKYF
jgi:hypothetical protein